MKKRIVTTLLASALAVSMLSSSMVSVFAEEVTEETAVEEEEPYTGDASLDNTRNQDEIGEAELLVVSFGTSFNDNRRLTIGAIEADMEEAFADYAVRRAFTAQIVIDHVKDRDGVAIDNVTEALDRAVANGVKTLVVQPTHLMNGIEYDELQEILAGYADSFEKIVVGEPLLTTKEDFKGVKDALVEWTADYNTDGTAIVYMGHGTHHEANAVYGQMQDLFTADGNTNYFVGTVEGSPSLEDVMTAVEAGDYTKVVLAPLMVVAGDHANNDMASDEANSWKTAFAEAGYEVETLLWGMGENEAIRDIYVQHAQEAVHSLAE